MSDLFDPTSQERTWEDIQESCGIDDRNQIKYLAETSYEFFFKHVLGYETSSPVTQKAIEFHQNPQEFKETDESMDAIKSAVVAPRGHSKTVSWTIGPTLWHAFRLQGVGIIISSASRTQSKDILQKVKRIIIRNEAINYLRPTPENIAALGDACDIDPSEDNWSATSIRTTTDVSISTKSFGSSIRGKHVDYVFLDDVLQDDKSGSRSTEQEKDAFYNIISPIVENKGGVLTVVGTPMTHDDLLMELIDKDSFHNVHFQSFDPETGEVLWPEKWSLEGLKQKKAEVGPARFAREYQTNPMSVEEQYFSLENCIEPNKGHEHFKPDVTDDLYSSWRFHLGVDVALSDAAGSDFNVFTVLGVNPDEETVYVVDVERTRTMSPEEIVSTMQRLNDRYGFDSGLYEKNAQGEGLMHQMKEAPQLDGRIDSFDTTRKTRPQILSGLQAAMYREALKIPNDSRLVKELQAFHKNSKGKLEGKGKDDMVMSLAIAYRNIEGSLGGEASITLVDGKGEVGGADGVVEGTDYDGGDMELGIV